MTKLCKGCEIEGNKTLSCSCLKLGHSLTNFFIVLAENKSVMIETEIKCTLRIKLDEEL